MTTLKNSIPTVLAIAAVSSCLMLGITGAYRLMSGEKSNRENRTLTEADTVTAEETDG